MIYLWQQEISNVLLYVMKKYVLLIIIIFFSFSLFPLKSNEGTIEKKVKVASSAFCSPSKNWGDTMLLYATQSYLPPCRYRWNWRDAVILRAVADIARDNREIKDKSIQYIKASVDCTIAKAHSRHPNGTATAFALPLLYEQSGEKEYMNKALEMYAQYMQIPRASNGGVSHRSNPDVIELWDDTVYMIGLFLLEMHRVTEDNKYLEEFVSQIIAHHEKLADPVTGLWYHGWDNDSIATPDECSQDGWSKNPERRNHEFWGRGNGWIAMSLADCLGAMSKQDVHYIRLKDMFVKMMMTLLPLQDEKTGHWLQLPVHVNDKNTGNYIESSCTVMYGYAIAKGIMTGVLSRDIFEPVMNKAYQGIQRYSIVPSGKYKTISNVCAGTCIGDRQYYYTREIVKDTEFAIGGALLFDNIYKQYSKKYKCKM
jgi:unsaturated rhamnogalacturonyl hydrolase